MHTFVPNTFDAPAAAYRPATQSVSYGGAHASAILLPIATADTAAVTKE